MRARVFIIRLHHFSPFSLLPVTGDIRDQREIGLDALILCRKRLKATGSDLRGDTETWLEDWIGASRRALILGVVGERLRPLWGGNAGDVDGPMAWTDDVRVS